VPEAGVAAHTGAHTLHSHGQSPQSHSSQQAELLIGLLTSLQRSGEVREIDASVVAKVERLLAEAQHGTGGRGGNGSGSVSYGSAGNAPQVPRTPVASIDEHSDFSSWLATEMDPTATVGSIISRSFSSIITCLALPLLPYTHSSFLCFLTLPHSLFLQFLALYSLCIPRFLTFLT
jgi:hypothetical protein